MLLSASGIITLIPAPIHGFAIHLRESDNYLGFLPWDLFAMSFSIMLIAFIPFLVSISAFI